MLIAFRLVFVSAALFAAAAAALVLGSFLVPGRAPQNNPAIVITLVVGAAYFGTGALLFGIQRQAVRLARLVNRQPVDAGMAELPRHVSRLLWLLLAGAVPLCLMLGLMAYAILARIDQGFAVFG
jgi:hypothetical protein